MSPVKRQVVNRLAAWHAPKYCKRSVLKKLGSKKKRKWMKKWAARSRNLGASDNLSRELALEDPAGYMNEPRMGQVRGMACISLTGHKEARHSHEMTQKLKTYQLLKFCKAYSA